MQKDIFLLGSGLTQFGEWWAKSPRDLMEEAVEAAERVDAEDPRLKFYRGILLVLKAKNPSEAESLLRAYLGKVPDNSELPTHATAHEWLGKLYESQAKFSEGAEEYRASLASDPHDRAVQDALKRVEKK